MIADFESLREMFGGLLAQVCLSVLLLFACGSAIAKLAKATGGPLDELWRKSRALFVALALFNMERFPKEMSVLQEAFDWKGALILALALAATRRKANVIPILIASGVLGVALGMMG